MFHGLAVGVVRFPAAGILNYLGFTMNTFLGGMLGLAIAFFLLFAIYGAAITAEVLLVLSARCSKCRQRFLTTDW